MADEISQTVELECKGVYYLLKGTAAALSKMIAGIRALKDWHHQRYLNKPGSSSWTKLQEVSDGMTPILEFPKEMFEPAVIDGKETTRFDYYCEKNNLRYCIMPDFNPDDDYIPVAVVSQDMPIHEEQIKSVMNMRIQKEEESDKTYEEKIKEAEEKVKSLTSDELLAAQEELQALKDARSENKAKLDESNEKLKNDNKISFEDYIKQSEGTSFLSEPEKTLNEAQTCGVVREFMPKDCMYPIRDENSVPESKEIYYTQRGVDDSIYTVRRTFKRDENGLYYSVYQSDNPAAPDKGVSFTDKGLTKEEWEKQLPEVLKQCGMIADQPTAAISSEDRMKAYVKGVGENFSIGSEGPEPTVRSASSAQAEEFIRKATDQEKVLRMYEDSLVTTFSVPAEKVMVDETNSPALDTKDGGYITGFQIDSMNSNEAVVSIKDDGVYSYHDREGNQTILSGKEIMELFSTGKEEEAKETLSKAVTAAAGKKR